MTGREWLCKIGFHDWSGRPGDEERRCIFCGEILTDHEDV
jgi:hypothetical protein